MTDPIEALIEECGISVTMEPIPFGPRDPLATIDEAHQHYLVQIGAGHSEACVRMVYQVPLSDEGPPPRARVLAWLAGDVWAIEHSHFRHSEWAAVYGLPADAPGVRQMFDCHAGAASTLKNVLGEVPYRRLLAIYESSL